MTWGVVNPLFGKVNKMTVAEEIRGVKEGSQFGNRTVIGHPFSRGKNKWGKTLWAAVVKCACGKVSVAQIGNLKSRAVDRCLSCKTSIHNTRHGGSPALRPRERLHNIWCSMRERCNCETYDRYPQYGGRGIKVCPEWDSYEAFRSWAWANGYDDTLTIDRIENDEGYSPANCQWLTKSENSKKQWVDKRRKAAACN